ncbi:MAG: cytochrome c-type biogenesis protein [Motiliproteus sp.]
MTLRYITEGISSLRSMLARSIVLMVLLLTSWSAQAVIDAYQFDNDQQHDRYKLLTEELRCPKCQNQNLAGSNSPIATDMRREIHRMVTEGQSNQDVVDFMVARYGDFVNYRPRRDGSTMVLWYGPIALLVIGGLVVLATARRRRAGDKPGQSKSADQEKLQRLLKDKDTD